MKKFATTLLLFLSLSANAQLQKYRSNFIDTTRNACYKTQRGGSVNVNISDTVLKQYCHCSAEYIANILNDQLAMDIEKGYVQMNPSWGQLAQAYCQKNYSNYKPN
jgi:hypothetical protein